MRPHWQKENRQHLAMALAAYGVRGLGLDGEVVRQTMVQFLEDVHDDEPQRRMSAVDETIKNHAKGKLVAWKPYYEQAGVTLPPSRGPSSEVLAKLEVVAAVLENKRWSGNGGFSDKAVYLALATRGANFGQDHPEGVVISGDVRTLSIDSTLSDAARNNALRRLIKAGLVRRLSSGCRRTSKAGMLLLLTEGERVYKLCHSSSKNPENPPKEGGQKEWAKLYTHDAFAYSCLNKSAANLLIALLCHSGPLTRAQLAKLVERASGNIRKPLDKLVNYGIVRREGDLFYPAEVWQEKLEEAAIKTGALRTRARREEKHRQERDDFQERHKRRS